MIDGRCYHVIKYAAFASPWWMATGKLKRFNMKNGQTKKRSRHTRYKVGICKMTVTVDNEDKVRADRKASREGYADTSAWLRGLIHEAVWDEPLLPEDYDKLKAMMAKQEA